MTRLHPRFLDPRSNHPVNQTQSSTHRPFLRWTKLAAIAASATSLLLSIPPAGAHMKGMFKTRQEAEKRAAELKCKGVFAMGDMWMPCANEQMLHKTLQKE